MVCEEYGKPEDIKKSITDVNTFCKSLQSNKVKNSQELFAKLPLSIQCLFLHHSWKILDKPDNYSEDSYRAAFYLFKLFRNKEMQKAKPYALYLTAKLEAKYKKALEWNRKEKSNEGKSSKEGKSKEKKIGKKKYDKEYQKHPEAETTDPLYIYYNSLYSENPNSRSAITWLTEYGLFEDEERTSLVKKYKKLLEKKQLIK
jgi:hypothetical protein